MTSRELPDLSVAELLDDHCKIIDELRRRGVVRSNNNPTGDYAEWLVSEKLGLSLVAQAARGMDAFDSNGVRYQIKGRRVTPRSNSTQLGIIRNLNDGDFDFLIGVIFNARWKVTRAAKISHQAVPDLAKFSEHQNGHVMYLRPSVMCAPGVEDITEVLSVDPEDK